MITSSCQKLESGTLSANMYSITCDLSHRSENYSKLFFSLTEMWLLANAKNGWHMETTNSLVSHYDKLIVRFKDPRDAIFFKLSPHFELTKTTELDLL